MKSKELADILDISEKTLITQFPRTRDRLLKKGIVITKKGRGDNAEYNYEITGGDDGRAETLFDETKTELVGFSKDVINLPELQFYTFIAVASTPNNMFHGNYVEFLQYLGYPTTKEMKKVLIETFNQLDENRVLMFTKDKTNEEYFFTGIYKKVEDEAQYGIEIVKRCKAIAEKYSVNNKRYNFISLTKVYLGAQILQKMQPYTLKELAQLTGMSDKTVSKYEELLFRENICIGNKVYYKDMIQNRIGCAGKEITFNVFDCTCAIKSIK